LENIALMHMSMKDKVTFSAEQCFNVSAVKFLKPIKGMVHDCNGEVCILGYAKGGTHLLLPQY